MVTKTLFETIFPGVIVENFDIVSIQHYPKEEEMHIHLDEKKNIPVEFSSRRVVFNGFTAAKKIQDYPIRGNAVYLHVCRRKWLDTETNEILTKTYSIAFEGTQLTKEFVSFFKKRIESTVLSIKTIGEMYCADGDLLARQYKQHISGFEEWEMRDTAEE